MIGKSRVGKGFYGVFRYALGEDDPSKQAHIIGGNLAGRNARELSSEVRLYRQLRPEVTSPVWHVPLAFHPDEQLNDAQMQQACTAFLDRFGVDRSRHQHLIARHHDEAHGHAHLIVNRVSTEGKLLDLHRDWPRVKQATRQVEQDLGLRLTVEKDEQAKEELRRCIDQTASDQPQMEQFCQSLEAQGIMPRFVYRKGKLHGIIYRQGGSDISGSRLGKEYSFQGLQKYQSVGYEPQRDEPLIKAQYTGATGASSTEEARDLMRQQIERVTQSRPTLPAFCQQLEATGITPQFGIRRGRLSKLDYFYQGQKASGAQLGDGFTFKGLLQLGIGYQPQRDDKFVKAHYTKRSPRETAASREAISAPSPAPPAPERQRPNQQRQTKGIEIE